MKQEKWYVGQKVWDETLRPGLIGAIEQINIDASYSIKVRFNGNAYTYDTDGRFHNMYTPTLRPYPHKITIERIDPEFEKGQIVLVRDNTDEHWTAAFFAQYKKGLHRFVVIAPDSCNATCEYKQCIPFEGNEHLLLTTQEP